MQRLLARTVAYADARPSLTATLGIAGMIAWLAVGWALGAHYDYTPYMEIWARILAGNDPWLGDPSNAYGPGHAMLALLFYIHPLAPKLLFLLSWIGVFFIIRAAGRGDTAISLAVFLLLFLTPFCFILVCVYGVGDALVTFLTLLAVDQRLRKGQCILPAVLLAAAALTKLYPLALLPFLATDRGKLDVRFAVAVLLCFAAGLAATYALWGWSVLGIVRFAVARDGKMLSIFSFLAWSDLSPLAGSTFAAALLAWNAAILAAALAALYLAQWLRRISALAGTTLAAVALFALYKVGNPQYFLCSTALLFYLLALPASREGRRDAGLLAAVVGYLVVLNVFQAWFIFFNHAAGNWQVKAFSGLPCFLASAALLWRLMLHERRRNLAEIRTAPT